MKTEDRLDKAEAIISALAFTIESHDRQLGLLVDLTTANAVAIKEHSAAMKGLDERIEKLVSGIGEFIRAASPPAPPAKP